MKIPQAALERLPLGFLIKYQTEARDDLSQAERQWLRDHIKARRDAGERVLSSAEMEARRVARIRDKNERRVARLQEMKASKQPRREG